MLPGQALAYKLGQLKFLELRERARQELGSKFDIRAFHDEMLNGGALPLDVLEGADQRLDREGEGRQARKRGRGRREIRQVLTTFRSTRQPLPQPQASKSQSL